MAGGVGDFWRRSVTDMGETGPHKRQGAKYLLVGPGQEVPEAAGYRVIQMPLNNAMFGLRSFEPDSEKSKALRQARHLSVQPARKSARRASCYCPKASRGIRASRAASTTGSGSMRSSRKSQSKHVTA